MHDYDIKETRKRIDERKKEIRQQNEIQRQEIQTNQKKNNDIRNKKISDIQARFDQDMKISKNKNEELKRECAKDFARFLRLGHFGLKDQIFEINRKMNGLN